MVYNRTVSLIATSRDDYSTLDTKEKRDKAFSNAKGYLKPFLSKDFDAKRNSIIDAYDQSEPAFDIVDEMSSVLRSFTKSQDEVIKKMLPLVRSLRVYDWVCRPEQSGFGEKSLGRIIGECGDLENYANPAKVWARMGCAPYTYGDQTQMGSTWKKGVIGKLSAEAWTDYGYCPRRRSVMYVITDTMLKNNKSVYRKRYLDAKYKAWKAHPEWEWKKCDEEGCGEDCPKCLGSGVKCMHAHLHGMLLMGKLLLKNLWLEWNDYPEEIRRCENKVN
jgi:hypothetical protein